MMKSRITFLDTSWIWDTSDLEHKYKLKEFEHKYKLKEFEHKYKLKEFEHMSKTLTTIVNT